MMNPAREVNEKGTRKKNDGNEVVEEGSSPPLDWISTRWLKQIRKPYPAQKRTGKTPNRWRSSRIWNQIFRLRYRLDRVTGQNSRGNKILTETSW